METQTKESVIKATTQSHGYEFSKLELTELAEHVNKHEYFLGKEIDFPFSWDEAHFSWYERVFKPIDSIVSRSSIIYFLTGLPKEEAFFQVSKEWYFASSNRDEEVYVYEAARRMCLYNSKRNKLITEILVRFLV